MLYKLRILEIARRQLRSLGKEDRRNIGYRLELMCDDLYGDVKKLQGETHLHRLRVGNFRVMFLLEGNIVTVYAVHDRMDAYE
jgi:mRNA interferase RelE/StbE